MPDLPNSEDITTLIRAAREAHQRLVYAGDHAADLGMHHRAEFDWGAAARLHAALKPFQEV
ncbi:hypothetical protein Q0601_17705 [Paracoccus onubensis]|uniref:hypothetical protein n=1 Tax=Paracoccus onubensis TaxID=1675788 RepID=UPI0027310E77|nr:hypothetical protein [Paracoccus onubensis]MDP0929024.1 hypothetical protein [Paracoccus onubensis]